MKGEQALKLELLQRDFKDILVECFDGNVFIAGKTRQQNIPGTHETCSLCNSKAFQRI